MLCCTVDFIQKKVNIFMYATKTRTDILVDSNSKYSNCWTWALVCKLLHVQFVLEIGVFIQRIYRIYKQHLSILHRGNKNREMPQRMLLLRFDENKRSGSCKGHVGPPGMLTASYSTVNSCFGYIQYIHRKFRAISLCNVYSLVLSPWDNWGVEGLIKWALKTINGLGAGGGVHFRSTILSIAIRW
jgi:hypothetical protein